MACDTAELIDHPPGAPTTIHGSPSRRMTVGETALARALPGTYELGRPGTGSIRLTPSFQVKPVPGTTTPEQVVRVWVMDTQFPSSSPSPTDAS
jgi:hypothetical protein